jgi:hypothetical protein
LVGRELAVTCARPGRWPDDPRDDEHDRDLSRGSRGSSDDRDSVRDLDLRDVFMSQVDLPRGLEREHVFEHDHDYRLRGSESRTMESSPPSVRRKGKTCSPTTVYISAGARCLKRDQRRSS